MLYDASVHAHCNHKELSEHFNSSLFCVLKKNESPTCLKSHKGE